MSAALELALLKVAIAPAFIGIVSLVQFRLGEQKAGWLVALPVNTGTIVAVLALTQGLAFASSTAGGALGGVISLSAFVAGYAISARRLSWRPCLAVACAAFAGSTAILSGVTPTLAVGVVAAVAACFVVLPSIRVHQDSPPRGTPPRWEIPLRMLTAGCLVLGVTTVATTLGPRLSGLIAPVPVFTITLVAFTHSKHGVGPIFRFLRGLMSGMMSFAGFCAVTAVLVVPLGVALAELLGLVVFVALYPFTHWVVGRIAGSDPPVGSPGSTPRRPWRAGGK